MRRFVIIVGVFMSGVFVVGVLWLPTARHQAQAKATLMTLDLVATVSRLYFSNCGVWPRTISELTTTNNPKQTVFLLVVGSPLGDGWGRPFTYIPFNPTNGSGSVQSHAHDRHGREVLYEVRFGLTNFQTNAP
jgi:hypothetical protein